jgi:hypothetical protein
MWESDDKPTIVYVSLRFGPPWFTTLYYSNWGSCKPAGQGSMKNRSEKLFIMDHGLMLVICEICVGFLRIFSYSRLHMVYRQQQVGYPMRTVIQEKWRVRKKHKSSIYRLIFHYKPSIMGYPHLWKAPHWTSQDQFYQTKMSAGKWMPDSQDFMCVMISLISMFMCEGFWGRNVGVSKRLHLFGHSHPELGFP